MSILNAILTFFIKSSTFAEEHAYPRMPTGRSVAAMPGLQGWFSRLRHRPQLDMTSSDHWRRPEFPVGRRPWPPAVGLPDNGMWGRGEEEREGEGAERNGREREDEEWRGRDGTIIRGRVMGGEGNIIFQCFITCFIQCFIMPVEQIPNAFLAIQSTNQQHSQ